MGKGGSFVPSKKKPPPVDGDSLLDVAGGASTALIPATVSAKGGAVSEEKKRYAIEKKGMGQKLSCRGSHEHGLFRAVRHGDLETVATLLQTHPTLMHHTTVYDNHSALHIAAANGQIQILSRLLDGSVNPDVLNHQKQTPLMLAAMHGKIACVEKLLEAGSNVLMFDARYGRTCLHYAAYYGHSSCVKAILSAAQSSPVSVS